MYWLNFIELAFGFLGPLKTALKTQNYDGWYERPTN